MRFWPKRARLHSRWLTITEAEIYSARRAHVFAPAKINLTLHVTGRRNDGYHLLDTLVSFASFGDRLVVRPSAAMSLTVDGPEAAGVPTDDTNLVLRAARLVAGSQGYALGLTKSLPAASGIGGGSSDAAAALRAVIGLGGDGRASSQPEVLALGADIPMCLWPAPLRARGIGEHIEFIQLPEIPVVLINPRVPVPTGAVFSGLASRENEPMQDVLPEFSEGLPQLFAWLSGQRNDLEAVACGVAPEISRVLQALGQQPGCGLARMSGSGATCFGLFETEAGAVVAAERLQRDYPGWWVAAGWLGDQSDAALPQLN